MRSKKPLGVRAYGSIPHLLGSKLGIADRHIHEGQHNILTCKKRDRHDVIFATEKYDGSNVAIAKKDGKILSLTRSGYEARTSPYPQHLVFAQYVEAGKSLFDHILNEGERLCCEWLLKTHSLEYSMSEKIQPIIAFDIIGKDNKRLSYFDFLSRNTFMPKARILHIGHSLPIRDAMPLLNSENNHPIQCLEKPEGIVYRCERKGMFDFCAKYVRADFVPGKYLELTKHNL